MKVICDHAKTCKRAEGCEHSEKHDSYGVVCEEAFCARAEIDVVQCIPVLDAAAELARVRELLLDTLNQATAFDGGLWGSTGRIHDMGTSAYEAAAGYLEEVGVLVRLENGHAYELAQQRKESDAKKALEVTT